MHWSPPATFPTSVSLHIFPVHPHDPGFVIMSLNYSAFLKIHICQAGKCFLPVWFMEEETETLWEFSSKNRRCTVLETITKETIIFKLRRNHKFLLSGTKKLVHVWVIIPTTTFYFDKLSNDTFCAQRTDVGVDEKPVTLFFCSDVLRSNRLSLREPIWSGTRTSLVSRPRLK